MLVLNDVFSLSCFFRSREEFIQFFCEHGIMGTLPVHLTTNIARKEIVNVMVYEIRDMLLDLSFPCYCGQAAVTYRASTYSLRSTQIAERDDLLKLFKGIVRSDKNIISQGLLM